MLDNFKKDLMYWIFGIEFVILGILMVLWSYDLELMNTISEKLTYDKLFYILGIVVLALGMIYISTPLSKILARNRTIQKWYINYKQKQRFKK